MLPHVVHAQQALNIDAVQFVKNPLANDLRCIQRCVELLTISEHLLRFLAKSLKLFYIFTTLGCLRKFLLVRVIQLTEKLRQ